MTGHCSQCGQTGGCDCMTPTDAARVAANLTPSTLAGIEEALARVARYVESRKAKPLGKVDPDSIHGVHVGTEWEAELLLSDIIALLSAARRGLDADGSADDVEHARRDLQYVDGLDAHMDEGGTCSPRNARDLIAMVRWNAGKFLALIPTERGERP